MSNTSINNKIVWELAAGELRARRSLRALEHQELRIGRLETDLSRKSSVLEELQTDHCDLLEVHRYQKDIQDLQRQLIKLQEIQYLTEFTTNPDHHEEHQNSEKQARDFGRESPQHIPKPASSHSSKQLGNTRFADAIKATSDVSVKDMGSLGSLLDFIKSSVVRGSQASSFGRKDGFSQSRCKLVDTNENLSVDDKPDAVFSSVQSPRNRLVEDDGNEKIVMLRETLSSHRESIEALSSEVVQLRQERAELMSYLHNLLEWKTRVSEVLNPPNPESFTPPTTAQRSSSTENLTASCDSDDDSTCHEKHDKHVRLKLSSISLRELNTELSLEERAQKMWTTACKFFTPEQANFILTAEIPLSNDETEEGESDF